MMTSEDRQKHSVLDHKIIGYALLIMAVIGILKSFFPVLEGIWKFYPIPMILVSVYFVFHNEPYLKHMYKTWMENWKHKNTRDHRILSIGSTMAFSIELLILNGTIPDSILKFFLPIGLVIWGIMFIYHHHPGEAPIIKRQHDIMSFTLFVAGVSLLLFRLNNSFSFLQDVWIWAVLILAYLYIAYSEKGVVYDSSGHNH